MTSRANQFNKTVLASAVLRKCIKRSNSPPPPPIPGEPAGVERQISPNLGAGGAFYTHSLRCYPSRPCQSSKILLLLAVLCVFASLREIRALRL